MRCVPQSAKLLSMKAILRRSLILGGIGALALAGGVVLGNFTRAGLDGLGASMNEMAALQAFTRERDAEQSSRRLKAVPDDETFVSDSFVQHVCEGCDARLTRDRQIATALGLYFPEAAQPPAIEPAEAVPTLRLPDLPAGPAGPARRAPD